MTRRGLPHSETPGSKLVCSSPRLIAAYCVLHRLSAPRHSPYALSSLTIGIWKLRTSSVRTSKFLFPNPHLNTACSCGSEKLPFAGYSVVKDQPGDCVPPDPLTTSLAGTPFIPAPLRRGAPFGAPKVTQTLGRAPYFSDPLFRTQKFEVPSSKWRIPGSNR
jgi:hypothetical protein